MSPGILDALSVLGEDDGEVIVSVAADVEPEVVVVSVRVVLVPLAQLTIVITDKKAAQATAVLKTLLVGFIV